ncbi:hypothetical protein [Trueperella bernardiae]|uniref:hypothetical protein n=1 Tax=Trueperella bernardiae TaxID=59561 RepID=UPI0011AE373B|nr:hypothetical protein [Trueperella bernardiae]
MTSSTQEPGRTPSLLDRLFDRESPARPSTDVRPPFVWASIGAFYAALIALGASLGPLAAVIAVALAAAPLISGWPVLLGLTNRAVSRVVMTLTLVAGLVAASFGSMPGMMLAATFAIFASFVGEMMRHDGRLHLIEHISASAGGAMLMISASMWVFAAGDWHATSRALPAAGTFVGLLTAIVIAVAALIHGFDLDHANLLGLLNTTVVGLVAAFLLSGPVWVGGAIGVCVGLVFAFIRRCTRTFERPLTWVQGYVKAVIPHCALGMIGYIFTLVVL